MTAHDPVAPAGEGLVGSRLALMVNAVGDAANGYGQAIQRGDPNPGKYLDEWHEAKAALKNALAALLARVAQLTVDLGLARAAVTEFSGMAARERERADRAEQDAARYRFLRSRLTDGGTMYDPANHRRHVSLRLPVNIGAYFPSGTDAISADAIIDAARTPSPTTTEPTA